MSLVIDKKHEPDDFCLVCEAKLGHNPLVPNGKSICVECLEHVQSADNALSVQMSKTANQWLKGTQ